MKKYTLTLVMLAAALTAEVRAARPSRARLQEQAVEAMAEADSLRRLSALQSAEIDSLQHLLDRTEARMAARNQTNRTVTAEQTVDPEQAAADSIADLQLRLQRKQIESTFDTNGLTILDTLNSGNDALYVILYANNTWKYVRNRAVAKDSTIFEKYWDTSSLFPYQSVDMSSMPQSVVIDLIDSTKSYHYPYKGAVNPRGKYGPRRGRRHQGVDLPLKTGDSVYATFCGRVRISKYVRGYGNLIIIRHDNGLETYYGHLSERLVEPGTWVEAGHVIGLGGSTGRSTGPHLHFETRYYGQAFDPERLIDFKNGILCRETFLLKKSFFSIYSNAGQDFEDEIANEEQDKKEAAEKAAMRYHKIRSGDTLGALAIKYGTTVSNICRLNGIKSTTILRIGRTLRVR